MFYCFFLCLRRRRPDVGDTFAACGTVPLHHRVVGVSRSDLAVGSVLPHGCSRVVLIGFTCPAIRQSRCPTRCLPRPYPPKSRICTTDNRKQPLHLALIYVKYVPVHATVCQLVWCRSGVADSGGGLSSISFSSSSAKGYHMGGFPLLLLA